MLAVLLLAAALSESPPDLTLAGLVLSPSEGRRVAVLRSGGRSRQVSIGETAFGGRVLSISAEGVSLEFESGRVQVPLASARGFLRAPTPVLVQKPAASSGLAFDRRELERRLTEEIPRILAETSLVPVTGEGGVQGYALARVPQGTLLSDAGLQPGDVITRVNDIPIDSMATLIGLWPRLRNETEIHAVVLRAGQSVPLTVSVR